MSIKNIISGKVGLGLAVLVVRDFQKFSEHPYISTVVVKTQMFKTKSKTQIFKTKTKTKTKTLSYSDVQT